MRKTKLLGINFSNGFVLGIACDKKQLQLAIIFFIIEFNFNVLVDGFKRFLECLKDN